MGFTLSFVASDNFLKEENPHNLQEHYSSIMKDSNCLEIRLEDLNSSNMVNFAYSTLLSKKGFICSGPLQGKTEVLEKIIGIFKEIQDPEEAEIVEANTKSILVKKNGFLILFNF